MAQPNADAATAPSADELLRLGAANELDLLRQEQKAERRLRAALASADKDAIRLRKAEARAASGRELVIEAEAALRACQERRAAGPPAVS